MEVPFVQRPARVRHRPHSPPVVLDRTDAPKEGPAPRELVLESSATTSVEWNGPLSFREAQEVGNPRSDLGDVHRTLRLPEDH
jgi:hypothetical protein